MDTDDGNPLLREHARKALATLRGYVVSAIDAGLRAREIRRGIHPERLATLMISSLEGAIMLARLDRSTDALRTVQAHLDHYLETEVRASR